MDVIRNSVASQGSICMFRWFLSSCANKGLLVDVWLFTLSRLIIHDVSYSCIDLTGVKNRD